MTPADKPRNKNMNLPKIEDGIEFPEPYWAVQQTRANHLRAVKPGQSFAVPFKESSSWRASIAQREFKGHFLTRRIGNDVRIWRKTSEQYITPDSHA